MLRIPLLTKKNFDPKKNQSENKKSEQISFYGEILKKTITNCNTKWFKTSWLGILVYVCICCLNYIIGYHGIYRSMKWTTSKHSEVRIFGDIVTVGWFSLGFIALPWHQWEELTWIKTRDFLGLCRLISWWAGTILTFFVYGYMGQNPLFQTSLASKLTPSQRNVYIVTFTILLFIIIYWLGKICPCKKVKHVCDPRLARKMVFIRLLVILSLLFVVSYVLCSNDDDCTYHLHHWWFGFVLIMLSTASLDNWFDYFLQGVFWTFLIESIFNYGLVFGQFFV